MGVNHYAHLAFGFQLKSTENKKIESKDACDEMNEEEKKIFKLKKAHMKKFSEMLLRYPKDWKETGFCYYQSEENFYVPGYMDIVRYGSDGFFLKIDPFEMCTKRRRN
jgi:hypothetical protein